MSLLKETVDMLLPRNCCVCGGFPDADGKIPYDVPKDFHICFKCLSQLVPLPSEKRFLTCLSEPYKDDPIPGLALYMPFPYDGCFSKAVPQMKFRSHPELARFAGVILGSIMAKDGIGADVVTPVPLAASRLKERGYNQAGLIACEAARVCDLPYCESVLVRTRDTRRQTGIEDNAERSMNVQGAFSVYDDFVAEDLTVLLIDDVATTGHTLHEVALALYEAGAAKVICAACAGNRTVLNEESC